MDETNPTYRELLDEWIDDWKHFRRGLRGRWQDPFDDLMDRAKQHADAASFSNLIAHEIPEHALLSICLQQQIEINRLRGRIEDIEVMADSEPVPTRDS